MADMARERRIADAEKASAAAAKKAETQRRISSLRGAAKLLLSNPTDQNLDKANEYLDLADKLKRTP